MSENTPKVGFVSLGCPKALVDSERILTQLKLDGYEVSNTYQDADVVVVNTCGFIDSAKQESLDAIGEAIKENGRVIVTGCMGKEENKIREIHPEVLNVTGAHAYEEVVSAVHEWVPPKQDHDPHVDLIPPQGVKLTPRHYAYLKISEGCNHSCTFCIIPDLRGKLVSRPSGAVLEEAERLVAAGTNELLVVSQDTSAYGVDRKYLTDFWNGRPVKTRLKELAESLGSMGAWIRMHYVYPYPSVDELIPLMADGTILPYLDIPLQHASPKILKAMKRPAHTENTLKRIQSWREICPEIALRSSFIVGFPGETEEDFQLLLDFLTEARLERVGCFKYSAVDGAKANELEGAVAEEVKEERYQRLMELQQKISAEKLQERIGQRCQVLVDGESEDGEIYGRSYAEAPEIDGVIWLENGQGLQPGDLVDVEIYDADEYDLYARPAQDD